MENQEKKEGIKKINTIISNLDVCLSFIKTQGVSKETVELFFDTVRPFKEEFAEIGQLKGMIDAERKIFYPLKKFFDSIHDMMNIMEVMEQYLFFQKIIERRDKVARKNS